MEAVTVVALEQRKLIVTTWRSNAAVLVRVLYYFFFFNDTATTEIYTLSLHDALPISDPPTGPQVPGHSCCPRRRIRDRKSTRLNSSHVRISYAVFCLKKKK